MATPTLVQTITHDRPGDRVGNCVAACVAAFFDVPLSEVPHFVELGICLTRDKDDKAAWWAMLLGYMSARGYWPLDLDSPSDADGGEVVFVSGRSVRGLAHQCLYRSGRLWFDPHPSRAGLIEVTEVIAWRKHSGFDHDPNTPIEDDEVRALFRDLRATPHREGADHG